MSFRLAASYTLSRFAGLPLKGKQVVTYLTFIFICCRQHFGELAACGGFSPFGAYGTTFPPAKAVGQQPVLCLEQHLKQQSRGALLCSRLRGGKGTGFVGSPWATENPVTRFPPGQRWWRQPPKGGTFPSPARAGVKVLFILAPSIILKGAHQNPHGQRPCQT